MVYFPSRQWPSQPHNLAVRVSGDVRQAVATVRAALQRAEPGLVLDNVGTMALQVERNVLRERLVTYLAAAFGVLSLLLGCVGLYGVLSYSVARRTQEFGVRLALGASPRDLTRDVFGDALRVALAGTAVGLVAALWASGLLEALLFEVKHVRPGRGRACPRHADRRDSGGQLPAGPTRSPCESHRGPQGRLILESHPCCRPLTGRRFPRANKLPLGSRKFQCNRPAQGLISPGLS